ncbi:MAG: hypothetical protein IBX43_04975 [Campylobacterales bacterium]|nr:hypothetical protein [Campylobacterales bacterium]
MPVPTTDIETIIDNISDKMFTRIKTLQEDTQMEDEHFATVVSTAITGSIDAAIRIVELNKRNELVDKQIATETNKALDIISTTAVRNAQSAQDILVKAAQVTQITEEKNYTMAKSAVTTNSRLDNLVIEALKAQQQQLATVGAGGLVPSATDFAAANSLRSAVYTRAQGGVLPAISFTAGTAYVKPV